MRNLIVIACLAAWAALAAGCRDNTPPPPRVPVPAQRGADDQAGMGERDDMKPMSPLPADAAPGTYDDRVARGNPRQVSDRDAVKPLPHAGDEFQPPYEDAPLVNQRPPEERAFVDSYRRVGSPRIALFVNRTLQGDIISVNDDRPVSNQETHLQSGQYNDAQTRTIDYQAIEAIMTDWLASSGQVTIISPTMARQRLSDQQVRDVQAGRSTALGDVAQQLDADVLIQVQAHPTGQTREGLQVRMIAEAINTKGGQSIGRAVVDIPPPLEKTAINRFTRFLARKLMDDMTATWLSPPPADHDRGDGTRRDGVPPDAPRDVPRDSSGNERGGPNPNSNGQPIPERTVVTPPPAPAQQPQLPPATQPTDPR